MPSIPVSTPLGYLGVFFMLFGFFLLIAGTGVISVKEVSVKPGRVTLLFGAIMILIGFMFLFPTIKESFKALSPTLIPTATVVPITNTVTEITSTPIIITATFSETHTETPTVFFSTTPTKTPINTETPQPSNTPAPAEPVIDSINLPSIIICDGRRYDVPIHFHDADGDAKDIFWELVYSKKDTPLHSTRRDMKINSSLQINGAVFQDWIEWHIAGDEAQIRVIITDKTGLSGWKDFKFSCSN